MLKIIVVHVDDESYMVEHIPEQVRLTFYLNYSEYNVGELNVTENGEDGITACFAPVLRRYTSRASIGFLLRLQEGRRIDKTRNTFSAIF